MYFDKYLARLKDNGKQIDFDYYKDFLTIYKHHEALERTLSVYTGAGGHLEKGENILSFAESYGE